MKFGIKSLCVVTTTSLLVALAGIANAATWEENSDLPGCAYATGTAEGQCGWLAGLDGNGPPSGWVYDPNGGRDGSGGLVSTDDTWANITQPHGLDFSVGQRVRWSYDVHMNHDNNDSFIAGSGIDTGLRGGGGWMLLSLNTFNRYILHSGGWGWPRGDHEVAGPVGGIPSGWYTLEMDWTVGGDANVSVKDASGTVINSGTLDTAGLTNPGAATHVNVDNGWTGGAVDNIEFSVVPEPSTWMLSATGLMGLIALARRRRK